MQETVRIFTLGGLRIEQDGKTLPPFAARKEEALLVYLAATQQAHPREVLADLLWDERTQSQALANLRVVLSGLRQRLAPYLTITRQMVSLDADHPIWLDSVELGCEIDRAAEMWSSGLDLASAERLNRALALYKGEFLSGFYIRDSQGFENWMIQDRERLHRQVIDALHHLVEVYLACGAHTAGITQASRLLQLDPLREEAHRQMMMLLARIGQRNAALSQFETCCRLLSKELGVGPSEETLALYQQIQSGKIVAATSVQLQSLPANSADSLQNPYKGLQAFQEEDSENFFGRESFVEEVITRLDSSPTRFLALVGPSGSGKSSIIRAGALPALRKMGEHWVIIDMVPGVRPFDELAAALQRIAPDPQTDLRERLRDQGLSGVLPGLLPNSARFLLVIDQFEEFFTLTEDTATRKLFFDQIEAVASTPNAPYYILIALRADFYDRPMLYPTLGQLISEHNLAVLPLVPDELERAIVQPAVRVGLTFEAGLVATLVSEVAEQPGILPLLQYALTELYLHRQDRTLTLAAYHEMGGVAGALSGRASELYAALDVRAQRAARQLFLRLVNPGEGTGDTRRRIQRTELASIAESVQVMDTVINLYGKYCLLTFDFDPVTYSPTVEIAHEALIRAWKQLREWLEEARGLVRRHRRLINAAQEWANSGCETSFLVSGERLSQFEKLVENASILLNQQERDFLEASLSERAVQQNRETERRQQEEALFQRSRNFLKALYLVALGAALSLLVLTGMVINQQQQAQYYERAAQNSALTATSIEGLAMANFRRSESARLFREGNYVLAQDSQSVELAALLYIRSLKTSYLPETETALLSAMAQISTQRVFQGHSSWVLAVAFLPDRKYALTASRDNSVVLWDTETGEQVRRFTGHTSDVNSIAVSHDGKLMITGSSDSTASLWDINTGQRLRTFTGHTDEISSVAMSPDGRLLVTGGADSMAILWDVNTGKEVRRFANHTSRIKAVSFTPDGNAILVGSQDGTIRLLDRVAGQQIQSFTGHTNAVFAIAISEDGKYVLSGSRDGTARLWDRTTGVLVQVFAGHRAWVTAVAFLPDGRVLTASRDGTARIWDEASGKELNQFIGHTKGIMALALSSDGQMLLTGSMDNTARIWHTQTTANQNTLTGHNGHVNSVAFSPDSRFALTGSNDNTARIWEISTQKQVQVLIGHSDSVLSVAYSPDGRYALTGSRDSTMRLWDVRTGNQLRIFNTQGGWAFAVAFTPDGKYVLATDGVSYGARLWDLESGAEVRQFVGHRSPILAAVFSADGRYLLTGSADNTARLWDVQTGTVLHTYAGHSNFVISVALSPDGKYVVTGGDDHIAILWNAATGDQVFMFPRQDMGAYQVAFSPDGNYIATVNGRNLVRPSDTNRTIQLWDVRTHVKVRTIANPDVEIYSLAFSPDGKYLLTGQGLSSAQLWLAHYEDLIDVACTHIFRDLTHEERVRFNIGDDPTCLSRAR